MYLHHVLQRSPHHHYGSLSPLTPHHSLIFSFCSYKTKPQHQHQQPHSAPHELSQNHHLLPCKHFSYASTIVPTITYTHCTVMVYVHHASLTSKPKLLPHISMVAPPPTFKKLAPSLKHPPQTLFLLHWDEEKERNVHHPMARCLAVAGDLSENQSNKLSVEVPNFKSHFQEI